MAELGIFCLMESFKDGGRYTFKLCTSVTNRVPQCQSRLVYHFRAPHFISLVFFDYLLMLEKVYCVLLLIYLRDIKMAARQA